MRKLIIVASLLGCILNTSFGGNVQCMIWNDDFGNAEQHRMRTLKSEINYHRIEYNTYSKPKVQYRDILLMRNAAQNAQYHKQNEYSILKNRQFIKAIGSPQFQIKKYNCNK